MYKKIIDAVAPPSSILKKMYSLPQHKNLYFIYAQSRGMF